MFAVPRKLKEVIVTAERRKRIFLCEIQTIQLQMVQENLNYAGSHNEWEPVGDVTQISELLQKKKSKRCSHHGKPQKLRENVLLI